jgi:hypothetical protein
VLHRLRRDRTGARLFLLLGRAGTPLGGQATMSYAVANVGV